MTEAIDAAFVELLAAIEEQQQARDSVERAAEWERTADERYRIAYSQLRKAEGERLRVLADQRGSQGIDDFLGSFR